MNPRKHKFFPISFGISVFGLFFSVWNVLDFTEAFCFSPASCTLFSEFAVFGISFWWLGVLFFTMMLFLALFGLAYFGKFLAEIGIVLDIILLCVMFYTMPCINCLIIGLAMASVYFSFCYEGQKRTLPMPKPPLLLPWAILFIMICGNISMSSARPWAISGNSDASIHVYFSTECSACATLIQSQGNRDDIAWYPVQVNDSDIWQVKFLFEEIKKGASIADAYMKMTKTDSSPDIFDVFSWAHWGIQFDLWKNATYVMRAGDTSLPFVEFHGAPSILLSQKQEGKTLAIEGKEQNAIDSLLGDVEAFCGDETEPCPEGTGL